MQESVKEAVSNVVQDIEDSVLKKDDGKSIYQKKVEICSSLLTRKDRRRYAKQHKVDWKDVGKDTKQMNEDKLKEAPKTDFPWNEYFKKSGKKDYSKLPKFQPMPKSSPDGGGTIPVNSEGVSGGVEKV